MDGSTPMRTSGGARALAGMRPHRRRSGPGRQAAPQRRLLETHARSRIASRAPCPAPTPSTASARVRAADGIRSCWSRSPSAAWVYWPITRINFFADEFVHFASIESDGILDFLLAPFGGHNYLVRNLFFVAAWELFGLRAPLYYADRPPHPPPERRPALRRPALPHRQRRPRLLRRRALGHLAPVPRHDRMVLGVRPGAGGDDSAARARAPSREPPPPPASRRRRARWVSGTRCCSPAPPASASASASPSRFPSSSSCSCPSAWQRPRLRVAWLLLPLVTLALYFAFRRLYLLSGRSTVRKYCRSTWPSAASATLPPMLGHLLAFSVAGATLGFFLVPPPIPRRLPGRLVPSSSPGSASSWRAATRRRAGRGGHDRAGRWRLPADRRRSLRRLCHVQHPAAGGRPRGALSLRRAACPS